MKWIKPIFRSAAVVLVVLVVLTCVAIHRIHTMPVWYGAPRCTPQQWQEAGRHAKQVFEQTFSWAADMQAKVVRARTEGWDSADTSITIVLTEDEINAFYDACDNQATAALAELVNEFVTNLRITFIDGGVVMSGKPKDSRTILSFVFKPKVDDQGHLDLQLTDILAGTLRIPRVAMRKTLGKFHDDLAGHLATEGPRARIDAYGVVNRAEIAAAYSQLLLNCLADQASDAIVFVPFDAKDLSRALAVRLADIQAGGGKLSVTLRALSPVERESLTQKITGNAAMAKAVP